MTRKHYAEHEDNRAGDGFPLGLPKPIDELTAQEIEAVGRRHNIWTRPKMARFLDALAQSGSVSAAAASVGMSRQSTYRLRARLSGQPFDMAWEAALEFGLQQLAHAALDRALNGVQDPVFFEGEQIGARTRYDERLTMFLLANPARVGRMPLRRELMLRHWQDLLTHVEHGPIDWEGTAAAVDAADQRPASGEARARGKARHDQALTDLSANRAGPAARLLPKRKRGAGRL